MDKIKNLFKDKKNASLMYLLVGVIGLVVLIVIISLLAKIFSPKYSTYEEVETQLVKAAKKYYESNSSFLPAELNESTSVKYAALLNEELIDSFEDMLKNGGECDAEVVVTKMGDTFDYTPYLTCGNDYTSTELYKVLTKEENIVTEKVGLYKVGEEYIYRGEVTNNYVQLGSVKNKTTSLYRIIKIDKENNISLISENVTEDSYVWDDRYNIEDEGTSGINNFNLSRLRETLDSFYEDNTLLLTNEQKSKIVLRQWCIGEHPVDKGIGFEKYECSALSENYLPFGTISVSEFMTASLDENCVNPTDNACMNYNYLVYEKPYWTITPGGKNSAFAYYISNGTLTSTRTSNSKKIRIVFYMNNKTIYVSGTGTQTDPYIIR